MARTAKQIAASRKNLEKARAARSKRAGTVAAKRSAHISAAVKHGGDSPQATKALDALNASIKPVAKKNLKGKKVKKSVNYGRVRRTRSGIVMNEFGMALN